MKNIIKSKLTEEKKARILALLTELENELADCVVVLTEEERTRFGSIKEQNKLLVNKTREYRLNHPALSSPDIDWDEFESDYQSRIFYERCLSKMKSLIYELSSNKILHDYDNRQDSLKDYSYTKYKNRAGEAEYNEKMMQMKQFFARTGILGKNKSRDKT